MPKGYHHVTRNIRSQIYTLKASGMSLRGIAKTYMDSLETPHEGSSQLLSAE